MVLRRILSIFISIILLSVIVPPGAHSVRIKDIASIQGIRYNQLIGYGLVVGLNGTGDKSGTGFTIQSLVNMMARIGIHINKSNVSVKNVAAVIVTAKMPPFAKVGNRIDVVVSSLGDAKSLQGGTLLLTPLRGVDRVVYALAQGPISVGGFTVGGAAGGGITKNHPTVGRIAMGATIEREIPLSMNDKRELLIDMNYSDFTTAVRLANVINSRFGHKMAFAVDSSTVKLKVPDKFRQNIVQLIATIENLEVTPDMVARVVLNEKTGTVVIGENVRISTVAIAHGNLSIQIKEQTRVSQPLPFAPTPPEGTETGQYKTENGVVVAPGGQTVISPESSVTLQEEKNRLMVVPSGSTIGELVRALNAIGVTPRDLITIFQSIKAAGALQADLEII